MLKLKPRVSDVIKHQEWCLELLMTMMKTPCSYPLDKEPTNNKEILALLAEEPDFESEEDRVEWEIDSIKDFNELKTAMEKKYLLSELNMDAPNALVVLDARGDDFLYIDHKAGDHFILLGEVPQMRDHIVVTTVHKGAKKPEIIACVHSYNFFLARPMDL